MAQKRRILLTTALPYANAEIHLGHILEHLITDFWARFQKMRGIDCTILCADDSHGTPIMISSLKQGIDPETLIQDMRKKHVQVFEDFQIHYDHYSTTHSKTNQELCYLFYEKIKAAKHLVPRTVEQYFCEKDKLFLPDRFVKGTCPRCGAMDQYGDGCEKCGATFLPTDLKDPRCSLCASTPVMSSTEQYFVRLENFRSFLQEWVPQHTNESIAQKLKEWLDEELRDWCISRDAPYFGFEIPDIKNKYFYVWFEAPIGYVSTTKEWCEKTGRKFDDFWKDPQTEIYHNIGKDIVYFHTLFWPSMLSCAGFTTPKDVWVHGMLTLNGEKMSKSKGTFINARPYLNHLAPEYFRYYLASKLSPGIVDIDLSFQDFVARVNSDLIGKITNIASRSAQLLQKKMDGKLGKIPSGPAQELVRDAQNEGESIAQLYEKREFAKAMVCIRERADAVNKYFDENKPWLLLPTDPEAVRGILTCALNVFRILSVYLKPVVPEYTRKVEELFAESPYTWDSAQSVVESRALNDFVHLLNRIENAAIDRIMEESKGS